MSHFLKQLVFIFHRILQTPIEYYGFHPANAGFFFEMKDNLPNSGISDWCYVSNNSCSNKNGTSKIATSNMVPNLIVIKILQNNLQRNELVMCWTPFYGASNELQRYFSNKLEHVHFLVIKLKHPNLGLKWTEIEHSRTHLLLLQITHQTDTNIIFWT